MSVRGRPAEEDGEFVIHAHATRIVMFQCVCIRKVCMGLHAWHIAYTLGLVSCLGLALGTTATGSEESG